MPSTTYNVDRIIERCANYSRDTIRDVLNEIQLIVYSQDCFQTMKILSTGMPPYIVTTNNIFEYDCPSDCRRTDAIFTESVPATRSRTRPVGPRREYYFRNKGYYRVAASSRDALKNVLAKVIFQDNPGSTTDSFYHAYYIKATEITSEEIELILPEETHWQVRKAVIAMLTTDEYGESPFDEKTIEKVARKIRNSLNRGFQGNAGTTPIPEEYQNIPEYYYGGYR